MPATKFPPSAILRNDSAALADLGNDIIGATPSTEPVAIGIVWKNSNDVVVSAGIPPTITLQPTSETVDVGDPVTFTVAATNATSYQWRRDGVSISGETGTSYTIDETEAGDDGAEFDVIVTGPGGSVTSDVATLTIELSRGHTLFVAEGDSITAGGSPGVTATWSRLWKNEYLGYVTYQQSAQSGSVFSQVQARAATVDGYLASVATWRSGAILGLLVGANDLATHSGGVSQYLIDVAAYCDARRSAGYKVAVCTALPRGVAASGGAGWESLRGQYNTAIRGWVGTHVDAVIDFDTEAIMGTQAGADDTDYYVDGLHPSQLGQDLLYAIAEPVLESLVTGVATPAEYSLWSTTDKGVGVAVSNGDLTAGPNTGTGFKAIRGAVQRNTGKYYTELLIGGSRDQLFGVVGKDPPVTSFFNQDPTCTIYPLSIVFQQGFTLVNTPVTAAYVVGDRCCLAIDFDTGKLWFGRNGVYASGGDPGTGANPSYTFPKNTSLWLATSLNAGTGSTLTLPASAGSLTHSIPSGFSVY